MDDTPRAVCPCGGRLWMRDELLASDDEFGRAIGEMYLSPDGSDAYCDEEDDVVPHEYWRPASRDGSEPFGPPLTTRVPSDEDREKAAQEAADAFRIARERFGLRPRDGSETA